MKKYILLLLIVLMGFVSFKPTYAVNIPTAQREEVTVTKTITQHSESEIRITFNLAVVANTPYLLTFHGSFDNADVFPAVGNTTLWINTSATGLLNEQSVYTLDGAISYYMVNFTFKTAATKSFIISLTNDAVTNIYLTAAFDTLLDDTFKVYKYRTGSDGFGYELLSSQTYNTTYQAGYEAGLLVGRSSGYQIGYAEAVGLHDDYYDAGYNAGILVGRQQVFDNGTQLYGFTQTSSYDWLASLIATRTTFAQLIDGTYLGYSDGYSRGYASAVGTAPALIGFIPGILGAAFAFFFTIASVEVLGVSALQILAAMFGIAVALLFFKILLSK